MSEQKAGDGAATPGPWERSLNKPQTAYIISAANEKHVCSMSWHEASDLFPTQAESAANARLIASAPDLLAALRQAERWIVQQMLDNGCPAERLEHPPEGSHLFNARAAIERAAK